VSHRVINCIARWIASSRSDMSMPPMLDGLGDHRNELRSSLRAPRPGVKRLSQVLSANPGAAFSSSSVEWLGPGNRRRALGRLAAWANARMRAAGMRPGEWSRAALRARENVP
jgi:hypothetical protein